MKNPESPDPQLPPKVRNAGRVLLCIWLAVVFGTLAAIAAFTLGFLLMAAQGNSRIGPLLMLLGTPSAFVVGAWLAWRWARRTVAAGDDR